MKLTRTFLLLVSIGICIGCEEAAHVALKSQPTDLIVVEGMITSENTNHLVSLSRTHLSQNVIAEPVLGAIVKVSDGTNTYDLTESELGSGKYYTPIMRAVTGTTYTLSINVNGKTYTAKDSPVPIALMPAIQYSKVEDKYELSMVGGGDDANFINYDILWDGTSACSSTNCKSRIVFYDLKNIDVNEIFKPKKAELTFPGGSTVVRTKYSLSASYRSYLRSMLSETEWHGGVFDSQSANVTTNLSEGAVGFFSTCTIITDTTVIPE